MKDTEPIKEALETDEIANALNDYLHAEGSRVMEDCGADPHFKLTRKLERQLNRVIRVGLRKQTPRYRLLRRSFIAAAALLSLFATVYASAICSSIANFFLEIKSESLDFSETANTNQSTWNLGISMPTNIPSSYTFTEIGGGSGIVTFIYTSQNSEDIRLNVYGSGSSIRIDSEGAEEFSEISINGLPGYYIEKNKKAQLFWGQSPACLLEGPSCEKAAMIGMAESMVYLPVEGLKYEEATP